MWDVGEAPQVHLPEVCSSRNHLQTTRVNSLRTFKSDNGNTAKMEQ